MSKMTTEEVHLTGRDMGKKWDSDIRDLVVFLVNERGIKFRWVNDNQHILLYPPDGESRPFKVSASRPGPDSVRFVRNQFMASYGITDETGVVPRSTAAEPEPETEPTQTYAAGNPREAVMVLARTLGVEVTVDKDAETLRLMDDNETLQMAVDDLNNQTILLRAEADGLGSQLLEVQQECVLLRTKIEEARRVLG